MALARGLSGRPLGSGDDDKEEHSFLFRAIAQTKCADLRSVQPATHQEDTNFPLPSPPRATSSSSDREQLEICPYYRDNPRARLNIGRTLIASRPFFFLGAHFGFVLARASLALIVAAGV